MEAIAADALNYAKSELAKIDSVYLGTPAPRQPAETQEILLRLARKRLEVRSRPISAGNVGCAFSKDLSVSRAGRRIRTRPRRRGCRGLRTARPVC